MAVHDMIDEYINIFERTGFDYTHFSEECEKSGLLPMGVYQFAAEFGLYSVASILAPSDPLAEMKKIKFGEVPVKTVNAVSRPCNGCAGGRVR